MLEIEKTVRCLVGYSRPYQVNDGKEQIKKGSFPLPKDSSQSR